MRVSLDDRQALDRSTAPGGIVPVFQPVVDLSGGQVVGYEALARGPAGSPLASPDSLFRAARAAGVLPAVDWACRCAAFRAALSATVAPPLRVFVNAEPDALDTACPSDLLGTWVAAHRALRVVVEVTERHLLTDLAGLLRAATTLRELGWEVALDDVGAEPSSLLLLPLVQPDVVKLDAGLLHPERASHARTVAAAVRRYADRTGALVVAEGIETDDDVTQALALGATLGQGWLLGRPAQLPDLGLDTAPAPRPRRRVADLLVQREVPSVPDLVVRHGPGWASPFATVSAATHHRSATSDELLRVVTSLLAGSDDDLVLLAPGPLGVHPALAGLLRRHAATARLLLGPGRAAPPGARVSRLDPELDDECTAVRVSVDGVVAVSAKPDGSGWQVVGPASGPVAVVAAQALVARTVGAPAAAAG